ncbi:phage portal protein [Actinomadura rubrisoli]|uniref:Phage portal protein n=1 Tax=Actinomadura rubrisoli TaxID=2530368 RepID=A0A4R5CJQ8_9ACTN|nr:phage portal protein [Actinomadura rubrisoli]TDD97634.1 phage portal protein [Actinomadura rubrisoli]
MALSDVEAPDTAKSLLALREDEQRRLSKITAYMGGRQDSVYVPRGARQEYRWLIKRAKVNILPLVVTVVAQSLFVDGYRPERTDKNARAWEYWQANRMDGRQHGLHRATLKYGVAYTLVLPGQLAEQPMPVITPKSPRRLTAFYADPVEDEWPLYAVEVKVENQSNGKKRQVVYLYDEKSRFTLVGDGRPGTPLVLASEDAVAEHGLGVCPVVRYLNGDDLDGDECVTGEVEPLFDMQDQLNSTTFGRMMAEQFAAFRQRYVSGMVAEDEEGRPRAPFQSAVDRLWVAEDADTKFGEFDQTELGGYLKSAEETIRHIATVSQTPPHNLLGQMANLPLALDTPVLSPHGRRVMGVLKPGDEVFAPDGSVVRVKAVSPVFHDHECYRMRFDDGTEVVADAQHRWTTTHFVNPANPYGPARHLTCPECGWVPRARKAPARGVALHRSRSHGISAVAAPKGGARETSVVTTAQIAASLRTSMGTYNHFIPVAKPWDGPERDYSIDPYALGVFLGDGDHIHGAITSHKDDAEEMAAHLRACGEFVDVCPYADGSDRRYIRIRNDRERCPYGHERPRGTRSDTARCHECRRIRDRGDSETRIRVNSTFRWRFMALDLRRNKHIPEEYFRGSLKQRLALLQGLMDTDGTVNRGQGSVAITLHDERLARDLYRLVCSLGHKVVLRERPWTSKQLVKSGICWRMTWAAPDIVFRLARKVALQRTDFGDGDGDGKSNSPFRRYVVACDLIPSVPVRCITVDSDDHQFCVTDSFVPTCNSAEALNAARDGLNSKVAERKSTTGESHEQTLRLASLAAGDQAGWRDTAAQVVWRDTESRSLAQTVDALGKLVQMLGVPPEVLWERIPNVTQQDVERWKAAAEKGDAIGQLNKIVAKQTGRVAELTAAATSPAPVAAANGAVPG